MWQMIQHIKAVLVPTTDRCQAGSGAVLLSRQLGYATPWRRSGLCVVAQSDMVGDSNAGTGLNLIICLILDCVYR